VTDLILHHYPASPFAEKIRSILGYKGLAWRSVVIPVIMPKPDLTALTGGYRKTPVLQLGCDVYCDTYRIAALLDELHPEPAVFPPTQAAVAVAAGHFFDSTLFFACIAHLFYQPEAMASAFSEMPESESGGFAQDRAQMMQTAKVPFPTLGEARAILADVAVRLDAQLGDHRPFLLGAEPGWADFCAYHPLRALRGNAVLGESLASYGNVLAWLDRMGAFGNGRPTEMGAAEALEIARNAKPRPLPASSGPPLDGIELDEEVEVAASDYGTEPVRGTLVHVGPDEVAVRRRDERAGEVVVHFPRVGFAVRKPG
jgi:glutathione S-transferase